MLKLSEIARLRRTVDASWRSPVADAAASAWGLPAGAARFWRSSASHVFVVPAASPGGPAYLRFVPAGSAHALAMARGAETMQRWDDAGLPVTRPVPSSAGRLTEQVETEDGEVVAMLVPAASGEELELEELSAEQASLWGAVLAQVHSASVSLERAPTPSRPRHDADLGDLRTDPGFVRAATTIEAAVAALDPSTHARGTIHGDFELDNLRFDAGRITFFDADETRSGWLAADVALAVRDLTGVTLDGEPHPELLAAFLAGYRNERTFTSEEESSLPLFGLAASVSLVLDLDRALDLDERDDDADWLAELRRNLHRHRRWHRDRVLASVAVA